MTISEIVLVTLENNKEYIYVISQLSEILIIIPTSKNTLVEEKPDWDTSMSIDRELMSS